METHPDEFDVGYSTKWNQLINAYKQHLNAEDQQALTDGLNKLMQQRFTEKVMEELVDPKGLRLKPMTLNPSNTTWNGASATVSSASFYPTTVIPPV